jgi:hypothetical protein
MRDMTYEKSYEEKKKKAREFLNATRGEYKPLGA